MKYIKMLIYSINNDNKNIHYQNLYLKNMMIKN